MIFLLIPTVAKTQAGEHLTASYDQFYKNFYGLNPAIQSVENPLEVGVGNRSFTGLFEGVSRFHTGIHALLPSKSKTQFHGLGLLAFTGKEGDYFNRNRFYFRYAWRTPLASGVYFSAGISGGVISYLVKSSVASGGGSAIAPDGNIGVWLVIKHFDFGVSYQQVLKSEVQPVLQVFPLIPFFNFNINSHQSLTKSVQLSTYLYISTFDGRKLIGVFGPIFTIQKIVESGFVYKYNRGFAITAGLVNLTVFSGNFRLSGSYLLSTRALSNYSDNVLEISTGFSLNSERKNNLNYK